MRVYYEVNVTEAAIPEPAALLLPGSGLVILECFGGGKDPLIF